MNQPYNPNPMQPQGFYQPPPQQPMQQGYQQPMQQGYQQPMQQGYQQPMQQGYQQPMQQGYQQPMQQQMAGPPVLHHIDDAAALEEYSRVREELRSGGLAGFITVPGPNGESNWDNVRPGHEGSILVHICGPWAPGKDFKVMQSSHFFKSAAHPQGNSVPHVEGCRFCASLNAAPKDQAERLKPWKRVRTRYLYNVCWLENLAAHYQSGQPQALILGATKTLHTALGTLFGEAKGASNVIDYRVGRPVRIIKRKTGNQSFDIEWTAVASMHAQPLAQEFWPVASNLVDLEKLVKEPTNEEVDAALQELGVAPVAVAQSYHPGAQPPYGSPYEVQGYSQQPQQPQQSWQQPPQQPQQPQQSWQQPPQQPQAQAMAAPPSYGAPQNYAAPAATQPPPAMPAPPPVTSGPMPQTQYQPQPAVPVQSTAPTSQMAPSAGTPQALTYPLPQGMELPDGRNRCFGSFDGAVDGWCGQCPEWIKNQCVPISQQLRQQTAPQQAQGQVNPELAALQNQMVGGQGG